MPQKPPAFQFYAKDWRSSRTVQLMSLEDRGIYIDLLAIAWDSDEPGTIELPVAGLNPRTVRSFLLRWPTTFECDLNLTRKEAERRLKSSRKKAEKGLKFTNDKLRQQWLNMKSLSEIRKKAAESRYHANAGAKAPANGGSASASASAPANITTTPLPPLPRGNHSLFFNGPEKPWRLRWDAIGDFRIYRPTLAVAQVTSLNFSGAADFEPRL